MSTHKVDWLEHSSREKVHWDILIDWTVLYTVYSIYSSKYKTAKLIVLLLFIKKNTLCSGWTQPLHVVSQSNLVLLCWMISGIEPWHIDMDRAGWKMLYKLLFLMLKFILVICVIPWATTVYGIYTENVIDFFQIPNHTENDCQLTIISCPYVQMGCETKVCVTV